MYRPRSSSTGLLTKLINHSLLHGADPFLRSCQMCSHSRTSQHFIEPEGSLPCSKELFWTYSVWLLIEYIRSYPPYLEGVSSIRNLRTRLAWWQGTPLTWKLINKKAFCSFINNFYRNYYHGYIFTSKTLKNNHLWFECGYDSSQFFVFSAVYIFWLLVIWLWSLRIIYKENIRFSRTKRFRIIN
jgi:hypothetical protein